MTSEAPKGGTRQLPFLEDACDATRMLGRRRTLFDMKERFAAEKARYDEGSEALEGREAELSKRDLDLQAKVRKKVSCDI